MKNKANESLTVEKKKINVDKQRYSPQNIKWKICLSVVPGDDLSILYKLLRFVINNFVNIDFLLIDYRTLFVPYLILYIVFCSAII